MCFVDLVASQAAIRAKNEAAAAAASANKRLEALIDGEQEVGAAPAVHDTPRSQAKTEVREKNKALHEAQETEKAAREAAREAERARVAGLESERDELAPKLEQARGRDCDFCRNWIHSALTGSCHGCWESVSTPRSWKAH